MKGEVVYLYAFDVAYEIITERINSILSHQPSPYEIRSQRTHPKDVPLYQPLSIEPATALAVSGRPVRLIARVYDIGAISITIRVPFEVTNLSELSLLHRLVFDNGASLDETARSWCSKVASDLQHCLNRPAAASEPEAYTVFCLTEVQGVTDVASWLAKEQRIVAGLLTETEPARLSEGQIAEVTRLQRTFELTDATVIDWDAALLVDLSGYCDDILYVMELGNLQLEEFRAMDRTMDRQLNKAYDDLERRRFSLVGVSSPVLRELRRFRVDVTKLADEVTHITKFLGDWYLARVYLAVRERFHLEQWRTSVESRLGQLDQLYGVVQSELNEQRMVWLEILIVVFCAIDIIALLIGK